MRERDIQRRFVAEVKKHGGMTWKFTSPGTDGVPDRIVFFPGKIFFVELKAPGQKMRPLQERRKAQIEQMGFQVYCIDSIEKIRQLF